MLTCLHSSILSQSVTDSITIHVETARKIALDLARLDYLDSTMIRKDMVIHNYIVLDSIRVDRIEDYKIEAVKLTTDRNKAVDKLKRRNKGFLTVALVALIEAIVLIVK